MRDIISDSLFVNNPSPNKIVVKNIFLRRLHVFNNSNSKIYALEIKILIKRN